MFFLSSSSCFLFTVSEVQSYSGPCCSFTPSELSHPHTAVLNPLSLTRTYRRAPAFPSETLSLLCHELLSFTDLNDFTRARCTLSMLYYTKCCYNRLPTSNHWDHTHAAATRIRRSSVDTPLNLNLNLIHSSSLCEESSPLTAAGHSGTPRCWKHTVKEMQRGVSALTVQETLEHLKGFPHRALTATLEKKSFRSFIKKHKCSNFTIYTVVHFWHFENASDVVPLHHAARYPQIERTLIRV